MRFPEGRARALTLSYDDGVEADIRLVQIMKAHGLKGTFNLNSGLYAPVDAISPGGKQTGRMSRSQCIRLFHGSGMEVAVHGVTHPFLEQLPEAMCTAEILNDRVNLEEDYGCMVRGMAYPFGTYNDAVVETARRCGIVYARTVISTHRFDLPTDWLRLGTTCHHNDPKLMELAEEFLKDDRYGMPRLFYLWGHSYEFETHNNWSVIEEFAQYLGNRTDIWYATNIEVYAYITAYRRLEFSADGKRVYNGAGFPVWFVADGKPYCVGPNAQICLSETMK